jgi:hypothetical protein
MSLCSDGQAHNTATTRKETVAAWTGGCERVGVVEWVGLGEGEGTWHAREWVAKVELQVQLLKHKLVHRGVQRLCHRSRPRLLEVRLRKWSEHAQERRVRREGRKEGGVWKRRIVTVG